MKESIQTDRTCLQRLGPGDVEAMFAYRSLPEVYRYHSWNPITKQDVACFIEKHSICSTGRIGEWLQFGIFSPDREILYGDCGYYRKSPEGVEIGYTIAPEYQGIGLATEVVSGLVDHLFRKVGIQRIHARTDPENSASIKVLQRIGFEQREHIRRSVEIRGEWKDDLVYCLERDFYHRILYFHGPEQFRAWLSKYHDSEPELWVGYYKKHTKIPSQTWAESVDEALCFGWIDGKRKRVDEKRYKIRFTPRSPSSTWSAVNINRMGKLEASGRLQPAGRDAFARKKVDRSRVYPYEHNKTELSPEYDAAIRANEKAWTFYSTLAASYRRASASWIMSAKREETRMRRLRILIQCSLAGEKIPALRNGK